MYIELAISFTYDAQLHKDYNQYEMPIKQDSQFIEKHRFSDNSNFTFSVNEKRFSNLAFKEEASKPNKPFKQSLLESEPACISSVTEPEKLHEKSIDNTKELLLTNLLNTIKTPIMIVDVQSRSVVYYNEAIKSLSRFFQFNFNSTSSLSNFSNVNFNHSLSNNTELPEDRRFLAMNSNFPNQKIINFQRFAKFMRKVNTVDDDDNEISLLADMINLTSQNKSKLSFNSGKKRRNTLSVNKEKKIVDRVSEENILVKQSSTNNAKQKFLDQIQSKESRGYASPESKKDFLYEKYTYEDNRNNLNVDEYYFISLTAVAKRSFISKTKTVEDTVNLKDSENDKEKLEKLERQLSDAEESSGRYLIVTVESGESRFSIMKNEIYSVMKSKFIVTISHEINNPLSALSHIVENLVSEKNEKVKMETWNKLQYYSKYIKFFLRMLSTKIKMDLNQSIPLDSMNFKLNYAITSVLDVFRRALQNEKISLTCPNLVDDSHINSITLNYDFSAFKMLIKGALMFIKSVCPKKTKVNLTIKNLREISNSNKYSCRLSQSSENTNYKGQNNNLIIPLNTENNQNNYLIEEIEENLDLIKPKQKFSFGGGMNSSNCPSPNTNHLTMIKEEEDNEDPLDKTMGKSNRGSTVNSKHFNTMTNKSIDSIGTSSSNALDDAKNKEKQNVAMIYVIKFEIFSDLLEGGFMSSWNSGLEDKFMIVNSIVSGEIIEDFLNSYSNLMGIQMSTSKDNNQLKSIEFKVQAVKKEDSDLDVSHITQPENIFRKHKFPKTSLSKFNPLFNIKDESMDNKIQKAMVRTNTIGINPEKKTRFSKFDYSQSASNNTQAPSKYDSFTPKTLNLKEESAMSSNSNVPNSTVNLCNQIGGAYLTRSNTMNYNAKPAYSNEEPVVLPLKNPILSSLNNLSSTYDERKDRYIGKFNYNESEQPLNEENYHNEYRNFDQYKTGEFTFNNKQSTKNIYNNTSHYINTNNSKYDNNLEDSIKSYHSSCSSKTVEIKYIYQNSNPNNTTLQSGRSGVCDTITGYESKIEELNKDTEFLVPSITKYFLKNQSRENHRVKLSICPYNNRDIDQANTKSNAKGESTVSNLSNLSLFNTPDEVIVEGSSSPNKKNYERSLLNPIREESNEGHLYNKNTMNQVKVSSINNQNAQTLSPKKVITENLTDQDKSEQKNDHPRVKFARKNRSTILKSSLKKTRKPLQEDTPEFRLDKMLKRTNTTGAKISNYKNYKEEEDYLPEDYRVKASKGKSNKTIIFNFDDASEKPISEKNHYLTDGKSQKKVTIESNLKEQIVNLNTNIDFSSNSELKMSTMKGRKRISFQNNENDHKSHSQSNPYTNENDSSHHSHNESRKLERKSIGEESDVRVRRLSNKNLTFKKTEMTADELILEQGEENLNNSIKRALSGSTIKAGNNINDSKQQANIFGTDEMNFISIIDNHNINKSKLSPDWNNSSKDPIGYKKRVSHDFLITKNNLNLMNENFDSKGNWNMSIPRKTQGREMIFTYDNVDNNNITNRNTGNLSKARPLDCFIQENSISQEENSKDLFKFEPTYMKINRFFQDYNPNADLIQNRKIKLQKSYSNSNSSPKVFFDQAKEKYSQLNVLPDNSCINEMTSFFNSPEISHKARNFKSKSSSFKPNSNTASLISTKNNKLFSSTLPQNHVNSNNPIILERLQPQRVSQVKFKTELNDRKIIDEMKKVNYKAGNRFLEDEFRLIQNYTTNRRSMMTEFEEAFIRSKKTKLSSVSRRSTIKELANSINLYSQIATPTGNMNVNNVSAMSGMTGVSRIVKDIKDKRFSEAKLFDFSDQEEDNKLNCTSLHQILGIIKEKRASYMSNDKALNNIGDSNVNSNSLNNNSSNNNNNNAWSNNALKHQDLKNMNCSSSKSENTKKPELYPCKESPKKRRRSTIVSAFQMVEPKAYKEEHPEDNLPIVVNKKSRKKPSMINVISKESTYTKGNTDSNLAKQNFSTKSGQIQPDKDKDKDKEKNSTESYKEAESKFTVTMKRNSKKIGTLRSFKSHKSRKSLKSYKSNKSFASEKSLELNERKKNVHLSQTSYIHTCNRSDVLIVDDESINRSTIKNMLKKLNITADEAENGEECLTKVIEKFNCDECSRYKLIFMDLMMPVMDGFEACKALYKFFCHNTNKNFDSSGKPRIIIVSAHDIDSIRESLRLNKCVKAFVSKPISKLRINHLINEHYYAG
eukprot:CAMPEP_0170536474 /NCGR_PEP_ID=MMETSP0209-20121228/102168_1 /TAXON_ID=665100 ORGANISM="Litonotus pictus, Strain P1" /NCGR_SAMPLE_ID=MMETSP0209 /ASSEMBLY_ACC=CAM_ASM_000301 /LENGTH=2202 /DNA_ID=CAMNT_0010837843 /DNA_START=1259 /DNA_END=7867 /DNA_ORIENTATION=-